MSGDHQAVAERDLTATVMEATSKSYALPLHVHRRGRTSNNASPMASPTHTNQRSVNFDTDEDRDNEVLTFHGLILRSQLTEMFKNKIFFNESEGVSLKTNPAANKSAGILIIYPYSLNPRRRCHTQL